MRSSGTFTYLAFGFTVHSQFRIEAFQEIEKVSNPDIIISQGVLPRLESLTKDIGIGIHPTEEGIYVYWYNFGTFLISEGRHLKIDPYGDPSLETLMLPLLGCGIGLLLHQRGYFTLHASASVVDSSGISFLGDKGAGKSTMAAAMHQAGHSLIVDDVVAVDVSQDDEVLVLPGFPQFKLWPETVNALGKEINTLPKLHPELEKRAFRPDKNINSHSITLSAFIVLEYGEDIKLERLKGKEALLSLFRYSYSTRYLGEHVGSLEQFKVCSGLIKKVPVFRFKRPRDLTKLQEIAGDFVAELRKNNFNEIGFTR